MKIVVTGTRGIPDILGGVETHCEELFPRIAARGHDVTVIRRSCYVTPDNRLTEYKGVKLKDVYAPRRKSLEAFVHTFLAVLAARRLNPDVVHIHAVGPSIMVPVAKLLGLKVVVTHHGPDYNRKKWGRLARWVIKTGERMSGRFADRIIAISQDIRDTMCREYGRTDTAIIYNGVTRPTPSASTDYLKKIGIEPDKYILAVGRFVPEKNFHQLIEAFKASGLESSGLRLVIAGDSDHEDSYSTGLKTQARDNGVVLTGFIKGEPLNQLLTNAALFVLPSSHEGLPISLLEAMSYGCDVLVSDIPANTLAQLDDDDFFRVNDTVALTDALKRKTSGSSHRRTYDLSAYDWDSIADKTIDVYRTLAGK